ncbi:sulfite exporter TauE/SafE family protein [Campylobacter canadensis]|uniref:sulfite exporter TauE/SafE family protein n=1 Tax=Campylobacter canadensis TaxID=449520 RepID=UPI001CC97C1A|nr:sulfite exporter TauE/SafE family protein [Campylobacter canadensis]MBZ7996447.1 sulfite exporter TauE/SafE family protein [Campylobacter canadensis]MBZ7999819.1 sulfite exporter TauE/SafE family protein [Campylobacter canadensis]MBZ8001700.1 sulfite exporter TauE/SafE family protein [Campylobacter canadensis]MBZ8002953.1 sulfite exporter TauE/SafE family protein [Campylobacter canadensis]
MLENYDLYTLTVLAVDGIFVGFISGLFAIGGGTAVVPVVSTLLPYSSKVAVGISVMQMVFSAFYNSYLNYKNKKLNIKQGIFPCLGGLIGGFSVGYVMKIANDIAISYLVLIMLTWAIIKFYFSPTNSNKAENNNKFLHFILGLLVGAIATSAGIGGAMLLTPALIAFCNFELKKAAAISGLFVAFSATSAFISMSYSGYIDYTAGAIIGFASLFGVKIGNYCFLKTTNSLQKKLMICFYLIMFSLALIKVIKQHGVF